MDNIVLHLKNEAFLICLSQCPHAFYRGVSKFMLLIFAPKGVPIKDLKIYCNWKGFDWKDVFTRHAGRYCLEIPVLEFMDYPTEAEAKRYEAIIKRDIEEWKRLLEYYPFPVNSASIVDPFYLGLDQMIVIDTPPHE